MMIGNLIGDTWNFKVVKKLLYEFGIIVDKKLTLADVATESEVLWTDELSTEMFMDHNLPNIVVVHYFSYGNWILYVVTDEEQRFLLTTGIIKDGRFIER